MDITGSLTRFARRLVLIVAECNDAQRRLTVRRSAYDLWLPNPDVPPEHYAEFLLRTTGVLRHEPSARRRLAGHGVH